MVEDVYPEKEGVEPMQTREKRSARALAVFLMILLVAAAAGCSSTVKDRRAEQGREDEKGAAGKYYFFDDVLVPRDLNYAPKKSFIYETPQFKTGSMVFTKWWYDSNSLVEFFNFYMARDNWKPVNSFKGKESVLNFSKPERTCTIKIVEKWNGYTEVEVRVGPLSEKKM
jgi:hypothetical protein